MDELVTIHIYINGVRVTKIVHDHLTSEQTDRMIKDVKSIKKLPKFPTGQPKT